MEHAHTDTSDSRVSHALSLLLRCSVDVGLNDPWHCIWAAPPLTGHRHLLFIESTRFFHTNVDSHIAMIAC